MLYYTLPLYIILRVILYALHHFEDPFPDFISMCPLTEGVIVIEERLKLTYYIVLRDENDPMEFQHCLQSKTK